MTIIFPIFFPIISTRTIIFPIIFPIIVYYFTYLYIICILFRVVTGPDYIFLLFFLLFSIIVYYFLLFRGKAAQLTGASRNTSSPNAGIND